MIVDRNPMQELKAIRKARWTQQEMALSCDRSQSWVSKMENSKFENQSLAAVRHYAAALGLRLTLRFVEQT